MVSCTGRALWLQRVYTGVEYQGFRKTEQISTHQPDIQLQYLTVTGLKKEFFYKNEKYFYLMSNKNESIEEDFEKDNQVICHPWSFL